VTSRNYFGVRQSKNVSLTSSSTSASVVLGRITFTCQKHNSWIITKLSLLSAALLFT